MVVTRHGVEECKPTGDLRERGGDDDVVALLRRREFEPALQVLMKRYGAAVHRYCVCQLRDSALADDIHQQVFIQAFRDLPSLKSASRVRSWLFSIARNRVLDAVDKRRRTNAHFQQADDADPPDLRPSTEVRIDDARLHDALIAALAQLSEVSRTAVLLRYQQGFTFEEIAEVCGEKAGTLQARVQRALPRLSKLIAARFDPR